MLIQPTVGRSLHFHLSNLTPGFAGSPGEPFACILAGVNNDHSINVCVFDRVGRPFPKENVPLVHEGEDAPSGDYCAWMPFQTQTQKVLAEKEARAEAFGKWLQQEHPELNKTSEPQPPDPSAEPFAEPNPALTGAGEPLSIDQPEQKRTRSKSA